MDILVGHRLARLNRRRRLTGGLAESRDTAPTPAPTPAPPAPPRPHPTPQACNRQNMYCVPLYDSLGENAIEYIIGHAEASAVFVSAAKLATLAKSLPQVGGDGVRWGCGGVCGVCPRNRLSTRRRMKRAAIRMDSARLCRLHGCLEWEPLQSSPTAASLRVVCVPSPAAAVQPRQDCRVLGSWRRRRGRGRQGCGRHRLLVPRVPAAGARHPRRAGCAAAAAAAARPRLGCLCPPAR